MGARRMVRVGVCVLMLLVVAGCDWLQSGYGSGHANYNPETELTPANVSGLTQKFTIATDGRSYKAPIIAGSTLYATSFESANGTARLEAFDTTTGNPVFATTLATGVGVGGLTAPVAANGVVYAATEDTSGTSLVAVNASSGSILWTTPVPAALSGSTLTIDSGIVMVPALKTNPLSLLPFSAVVGVDATTGGIKWTWTADELSPAGPFAAPVASSQGLVAIAYDAKSQFSPMPSTSVFDESDGVTVWETNPLASTSDYLQVAANGLFYGTVTDPATLNTVTGAVDPATGSFVWTTPALLSGTPAVSGRSAVGAYFLNDTAMLLALDARTGAGQWTSPPANGATSWSDPVIAGGVVFWATTDGTTATLRAYDANTGSQAAAITLPTNIAPRPVVANGHVYIADGTSITAYALS